MEPGGISANLAAGARVFRFAPSPNGYLHLGHAFSALLNTWAAAATGGRFLLRIEDIDTARARSQFEAAIYEDLGWLGLAWEAPVLRQSERFDAYREALRELGRLDLVYPALLSRAEIAARVAALEAVGTRWPRDPDGAPLYPGPERDWPLAKRRDAVRDTRPHVLRIDMRRVLAACPVLTWREAQPGTATEPVAHRADPAAWGDVILARRETPASYHLAVVVDDAFQGVTDVVRGRDLQPATAVHRVLQTLLGLPEPRYFHHRLILDDTGQKLSKSRGSAAIRARRAARESPQDVVAEIDLPILSRGPAAAERATARP